MTLAYLPDSYSDLKSNDDRRINRSGTFIFFFINAITWIFEFLSILLGSQRDKTVKKVSHVLSCHLSLSPLNMPLPLKT